LYTAFYHPEEAPKSPLTQWTLYEGQTRISEPNAPLFRTGFSSHAIVDVEVPANASGVIFCVGGAGGGFTVYMDSGYLHAEYAATLLYRFKVKSPAPIQPGPAKIDVKLTFDPKLPPKAATLALTVNGEDAGKTVVEKSCALILDASETFDVGMDLGSTVSLEYHSRAPFEFSGLIKSLSIQYVNGSLPEHAEDIAVVI